MRQNLFTDDRKGHLDAERLKAHGLTKQRMNEKDAFFFLQYCCLLVIHQGPKCLVVME
jgi:hypothetical protein